MKRSKFSEEQIITISKVQEAEVPRADVGVTELMADKDPRG